MADWTGIGTKREAELEALAGLYNSEEASITLRAAALLTAHQRLSAGSCLCGWSELGQSHPRHQAEMLREVGLLASRNSEERGSSTA